MTTFCRHKPGAPVPADDTLSQLDDLLAALEDHWQSPCGKWHKLSTRHPHRVKCCCGEFDVNTDPRAAS